MGKKHVFNPSWVTPHVGVWIETVDSTNINIQPKVTPHVGVWIETAQLLIQ